VIAEYERGKIRERTLGGKHEKALRGLIVGQCPHGEEAGPAGQATEGDDSWQ